MHSGFRWGVIGAWLLCMGTLTCSSALILPSRAIWLDESAQMSGLEMGPIRVVRLACLQGRLEHRNP